VKKKTPPEILNLIYSDAKFSEQYIVLWNGQEVTRIEPLRATGLCVLYAREVVCGVVDEETKLCVELRKRQEPLMEQFTVNLAGHGEVTINVNKREPRGGLQDVVFDVPIPEPSLRNWGRVRAEIERGYVAWRLAEPTQHHELYRFNFTGKGRA
jgi:hypothetical protein